MLSTFSIKALSVLITDFKNSWSDIPTLLPCLDSGPDAFQSLQTFLPFSIPCHFLLKGVHDIPYKRSAEKEPFSDVVVRYRGRV